MKAETPCGYRMIMKDWEWDALSISTRRYLVKCNSLVYTKKYIYAFGCRGNLWTIVRYDRKPHTAQAVEGTKLEIDHWR